MIVKYIFTSMNKWNKKRFEIENTQIIPIVFHYTSRKENIIFGWEQLWRVLNITTNKLNEIEKN